MPIKLTTRCLPLSAKIFVTSKLENNKKIQERENGEIGTCFGLKMM